MIFSEYPQIYFPRLTIQAVAFPGNKVGDLGQSKERFLDKEIITGFIPKMLKKSFNFVRRNIREKTIIINGERTDQLEYPLNGIREALLNALIHRDYSNESSPILINTNIGG